jgi:hypothetical protein
MVTVRARMAAKVKRARRTLADIKGFGDKLRILDQVSSNIGNLLKFQEGLESRRRMGRYQNSGIKQAVFGVDDIINLRSDIEATADGTEKVAFLELLLHQLRQRHIVSQEAMRHRNVGKGPRADLRDARIFLISDSKHSMPKLSETLRYMENPAVKNRKIGTFYMLRGNGGALDRVREWAESYMKQKYGEYLL